MSKSLNSPSKAFEFGKSVVEGKVAEIDKMRSINSRPNTTEGVFREGVGTHVATAAADASATQVQEHNSTYVDTEIINSTQVDVDNVVVNVEGNIDVSQSTSVESGPKKPAGWNYMPTEAQDAWRKEHEYNDTQNPFDNEKPAGWKHMPTAEREAWNKAHEQKPAGMPESDWQKYRESRARTEEPQEQHQEQTPPSKDIPNEASVNGEPSGMTGGAIAGGAPGVASGVAKSGPEKPAGWEHMPAEAQEAWRKQNEGNTSSMRKSVDAEVNNILKAFGGLKANEASVELE